MRTPYWVDSLPGAVETVGGLLVALLVIWGFWLGVYRPIKKHFDRVNAGMDTLLGYAAVKDPGSGREIQPAMPPLAMRVWDLEQTQKRMADALEILADNQRALLELRSEMEERRRVGDQILADFTDWRRAVNQHLTEWASEQDELSHLIREQIPPHVPNISTAQPPPREDT